MPVHFSFSSQVVLAEAVRQAQGVVVHNVALRRTGTNPVADLQTLWSLWRLMRRVRPDCVLGYTVKPVIYGPLAAWLAGVPRRFALVTGLGYAFQQQGVGLGRFKRAPRHCCMQRVCAAQLP